MPYKIHWLLEDRIIYVYLSGNVTTSEVESLLTETLDKADLSIANTPVPVLIHSIIDSTDIARSEISIGEIRRIFSANKERIIRPGWTLTVIPATILRFFGTLALQFLGVRGRQVAAVDEALKFLADVDDTLPSLQELAALHQKLHTEIGSSVNK
ncbi:MAG: hypothetical protein ACPG7F_10145 [Aggregatilineales bacterium]